MRSMFSRLRLGPRPSRPSASGAIELLRCVSGLDPHVPRATPSNSDRHDLLFLALSTFVPGSFPENFAVAGCRRATVCCHCQSTQSSSVGFQQMAALCCCEQHQHPGSPDWTRSCFTSSTIGSIRPHRRQLPAGTGRACLRRWQGAFRPPPPFCGVCSQDHVRRATNNHTARWQTLGVRCSGDWRGGGTVRTVTEKFHVFGCRPRVCAGLPPDASAVPIVRF